MYESISSRVIQSLTRARGTRRDGQGFINLRSRVPTNSLDENLAYIPAYCRNAHENNNTIRLDVNPAYTANPDDLDSQGHLSTAYTTSEDLDLSQCNVLSESSVQNVACIPTHSGSAYVQDNTIKVNPDYSSNTDDIES